MCTEPLCDFACEVYQTGLEKLRPVDSTGVGTKETFDSGHLGKDPHTGRPGGFVVPRLELMEVLVNHCYTGMGEEHMMKFVEEMDGQAESIRTLAETVQMKLTACTKYDEVKALTDKLTPILREAKDKIGML